LVEVAGASLNVQNTLVGNGYTPLMEAILRNDSDLLEILLQRDPRLVSTTTSKKYKYSPNMNLSMRSGCTGLILASMRGLLRSMEVLVQRDSGCQLDAKDLRGWTALHYACAKPDCAGLPAAILLLEAGAAASLNDNENRDARALALQNGNHPVVRFLEGMGSGDCKISPRYY
jgi:ankyrin repeat protein